MHPDKLRLTDDVTATLAKARSKDWSRDPRSKMRTRVNVEVVLRDEFGNVKHHERGENLVTDYGDEHIARRVALNAQNIVTGMRLGTGSTAALKAGAGAAIVTYIAGSQEALDAAATFLNKGAGLGHRTIHVCTWAAGDVTNSAIREVVLTDETPLTDVAGAAGNTVARFVFGSAIDKQAGDTLEVTWNIDVLGA